MAVALRRVTWLVDLPRGQPGASAAPAALQGTLVASLLLAAASQPGEGHTHSAAHALDVHTQQSIHSAALAPNTLAPSALAKHTSTKQAENYTAYEADLVCCIVNRWQQLMGS